MQKLIMTAIVLMCTLVISAQNIFTNVAKFDKFDDVVWYKDKKTLITMADSAIIIETKGQKPVEYYIMGGQPLLVVGSKDSIVNLADNLYGYEEQYVTYTKKNFEDKKKQIVSNNPEYIEKGENYIDFLTGLGLLDDFKNEKLPVITIRTLSESRFSFIYRTELVWIRFNDGSRLVYSKH